MSSMQGKVVWITGASSGIGEAMAYVFAQAGAKLVLSARRADELERVKNACKTLPENVLVLPIDVADSGAAFPAFERIMQTYGQLDILINNAGLSHWSKINDMSMDVLKRIIDVNFMGGVALTKAVLPHMLQRKQGNIVVVSSVLGKIVTPKQAAYNASKHALHGFYDTLRAEYGGSGINVLLVCPGFVRTNVAKNSLNKEGQPINKDNAMIANGLDPRYVGEQVLAAIQSGKEEIILAGFKEKLAVLMKRFIPGMFSKMIQNTRLA